MERNLEEIKTKIMEKLPALLPQVLKSVVIHVVMFLYHVSLPPWVTVIKIKKALQSRGMDGNSHETRRYRSRRMEKRNRRKRGS